MKFHSFYLQINWCHFDQRTQSKPQSLRHRQINRTNHKSFRSFVAAILTTTFALPFLFGGSGYRRSVIEYQTPADDWNITSVPRSITPHLPARNASHYIMPPRKSSAEIDEETLERLRDIKVRIDFCDIFFSDAQLNRFVLLLKF